MDRATGIDLPSHPKPPPAMTTQCGESMLAWLKMVAPTEWTARNWRVLVLKLLLFELRKLARGGIKVGPNPCELSVEFPHAKMPRCHTHCYTPPCPAIRSPALCHHLCPLWPGLPPV